MENKQLCEYCGDGEINYTEFKGTHIYTCDTCPNVTFEFLTNDDILKLQEFLNNGGSQMTENQKIKLCIAESIGIKYTNDVQLSREIKSLIENDEEIILNVADQYNLDYGEVENVINELV